MCAVMISISLNSAEIQRELNNVRKQAKFATAVALTKTAKSVKEKEQNEMRRVYDRPKPFTVNSVFIKPASKRQPEPFAIVGLKNRTAGTPAAKYLYRTIEGGARALKKSEAKLKGRGILPRGSKIVPGERTRLNRFGNLTKTQIKAALTAKDHGSKYFVSNGTGRTRHLTPGVWRRQGRKGRKIIPYIVFITNTQYRKQFKFYDVGNREAERVFDGEFGIAFDRAMRSSR